MKRSNPRYATEAALCADFIEWVKRMGGQMNHGRRFPKMTPYAETANWDILLVAEDGMQIGVQAKLRFNMKVLEQAIPDGWGHWHDVGPDFRAILIPDWDSTIEKICTALGLGVFHPVSFGKPEFAPDLTMQNRWCSTWHDWNPKERHKLPQYVPDVIAGDSAPVRLTEWKIAALRLVATMTVRGYITRQDFRTYSIDPRRWTGPSGWLKPGEERGTYIRGDNLDFDRQHPDVYAKVLDEIKEKFAREIAP
jgi:hypothetical protein